MQVLTIIPARGGSKRIPRKNVRSFHGHPIISYPIRAAKAAGCMTEVMVSTEDAEIADIARSYGAKVPFLRSVKTATDYATTADVIAEVLNEYRQQARTFEYVCCIYATAALATTARIAEGFERIKRDPSLQSVVPVVQFGYPIQRAMEIARDRLSMVHLEHLQSRSQDLPPRYHDAGQWYWLRVSAFLTNPTLLSANTAPVILDENEAQDIDNESDWRLAELKFAALSPSR